MNADDIGAPWGWDDEDKPVDQYIHIYSDRGTEAALCYRSDQEREEYAAFASRVVEIVNLRYGGFS